MDILKTVEASVSDGNVWPAEFQCGLYPLATVEYLPPERFRFVTLSLMARGLRGWNGYMAVTPGRTRRPTNGEGRTSILPSIVI